MQRSFPCPSIFRAHSDISQGPFLRPHSFAPPPSPAMLLLLACRKGFFRVVPLPLRDACGAQGMHAEADPDMMRAGGDPPRFHRIGRGIILRAASLRGPKDYPFSWRKAGFAGYLSQGSWPHGSAPCAGYDHSRKGRHEEDDTLPVERHSGARDLHSGRCVAGGFRRRGRSCERHHHQVPDSEY